VRTRLQRVIPAQDWIPGDRAETAENFAASIEKLEDCMECACEDLQLSWSSQLAVSIGHPAHNDEYHPVIHYERTDASPSTANARMHERVELAIETGLTARRTASMELQGQQPAQSPLTRFARQVRALLSDPLRGHQPRSPSNTTPHRQFSMPGTHQGGVQRIDENAEEEDSDDCHDDLLVAISQTSRRRASVMQQLSRLGCPVLKQRQ